MNNPEQFIEALNTMLFSWGGDTPPEALWAMTEFVKWLNKEYDLNLPVVTEADYYENQTFHDKFEEIKEAVQNLKRS